MRRLRVVGIGGGTGLSVLLAGLGRASERARRAGGVPLDITAVVSVADDGGSSGHLSREFGIPSVGDLRNCLVALSEGDRLWGELFQHRFGGGNGLRGHALGNLVVAALIERAGALSAAVERLGRSLGVRGRVLPATDRPVTLEAEIEGGGVVVGESLIPGAGGRIARVWLRPEHPEPAPGVLEALAAADAIVLGPGSLYTSVVPPLLVGGVAEAIRRSRALTVFACNLLTQRGETDGFDAGDHLAALEACLGPGAVDVCLVNDRDLPEEAAGPFRAAGVAPVRPLLGRPALGGAFPVRADLLREGRFDNRHDPDKLAAAVVSLARGLRVGPRRPPVQPQLAVPVALHRGAAAPPKEAA